MRWKVTIDVKELNHHVNKEELEPWTSVLQVRRYHRSVTL